MEEDSSSVDLFGVENKMVFLGNGNWEMGEILPRKGENSLVEMLELIGVEDIDG